METVGEAETGLDAIAQFRAHTPGVSLMDLAILIVPAFLLDLP